jgi:hypothetical protein
MPNIRSIQTTSRRHPVALLAKVRSRHEGSELIGKVKYCVFRETSYFLGVELGHWCRWSQGSFARAAC